jgi:large subunit ribosomal protein L17
MRHLLSGRKFNRDTSARKALLRALATSLIVNGKITTTLAKAKDIRPVVEKLITKAKKGKSVETIRGLSSYLYTSEAVEKAFVFAEQNKTRNGGYLRILKNGTRKGDNAPIAIIEFVA